jgi:hypothetical protein
MLEELEVLRIVSERLEAARLPYMLTGSFAMAYYGRPRMTRDLDIVVSMQEDDIAGIVEILSPDFYIDADSVRSAVLSKLVWAKDSGSELQRRDVRTLLDDSMDRAYLERWASRLQVDQALAETMQ